MGDNNESLRVRLPESWTQIAAKHGLIGLLLLLFVAAFFGLFDNPITRTATAVEAHVKDTDRHQKIQMQMSWYNQRVLEQICIRLSTTTDERNRCLPIQMGADDTRSNR